MSGNTPADRGARDAQQGKGAANTNGWSSQEKEKYNAAYSQNKK